MWIEIRHETTRKLLFRYDPIRELIETCQRGQKTVTDLLAVKGQHADAIENHVSVPNAFPERR